jgi:hypothetical protein
VNGPAHLPRQVILPVAHPPGVRPLPDQRLFKFRRGTQNMEQEPGRRILKVGVQSLCHRDEPDTVVFQDLDVV